MGVVKGRGSKHDAGQSWNHRWEVKGCAPNLPKRPAPRPPAACRLFGAPTVEGSIHCRSCALEVRKDRFVEVARFGRIPTPFPTSLERTNNLRLDRRRIRACQMAAVLCLAGSASIAGTMVLAPAFLDSY